MRIEIYCEGIFISVIPAYLLFSAWAQVIFVTLPLLFQCVKKSLSALVANTKEWLVLDAHFLSQRWVRPSWPKGSVNNSIGNYFKQLIKWTTTLTLQSYLSASPFNRVEFNPCIVVLWGLCPLCWSTADEGSLRLSHITFSLLYSAMNEFTYCQWVSPSCSFFFLQGQMVNPLNQKSVHMPWSGTSRFNWLFSESRVFSESLLAISTESAALSHSSHVRKQSPQKTLYWLSAHFADIPESGRRHWSGYRSSR